MSVSVGIFSWARLEPVPGEYDFGWMESGGPRVIVEDEDWLVVVPFWAAWPFEVMIVAKRPGTRLADHGDTRDSLSAAERLRALVDPPASAAGARADPSSTSP